MVMSVAVEFDRYCRGCRYALAGVADHRCPECGLEFDPVDERTTLPARRTITDGHLRDWARHLIIVYAIVSVICFLASFAGVDPLCIRFPAAMLSILWIAGAIVLWYAALAPSSKLRRRRRIAAVVLPIVFISIVWTDWPFVLRFWPHKPALERLADQVQVGQVPATPHRIGMFNIIDVDQRYGNVGFQLSGDSGGGRFLVRRAPGATRLWYNTNWEIALGDDWYYVYED